MKSWSLKIQITGLVIGIVAVALVLGIILFNRLTRIQLHDSLALKANNISSILVNSASADFESNRDRRLSDIVSGLFADEDIKGICIYNSRLEPVYHRVTDGQLETALQNPGRGDSLTVEHHGDCYVLEWPVVDRDQKIGRVWLAVSQNSVSPGAGEGLSFTLIAAAVILFLSAFIAVATSRRFVRPLRVFEEVATRIGNGDHLSAIDWPNLPKDFQPLAGSFDDMQRKLESALRGMSESRSQLEHQLDERTSEFQNELAERQRVEKALREGGELLRATLESTADGILVVNEEGHVTHTNTRCAEMWRIPKHLISFADDRVVLDCVMDQLVDPDSFLAKIDELHESSDHAQDTLYFKDGTVLERFSFPLIQDDRKAGRVCSFRDITHQKQAEEALRESEVKYRTLFDAAPVAIFLWRDGLFMDCNPFTTKLLGCSRKQIIGESPFRFSPPKQPDGRDSFAAGSKIIESVLAGESHFFEWQHAKYDGTPVDTEVNLNRVELGGDVMLLCFVRDISDRKYADAQRQRLQEKLERAQRMESLGILAGGVAHDLNNMLGPLVGYPELILSELPQDSPLGKRVTRIGSAAQEAADVVQDLLTLARRGRYEMIPINLNGVIDSYLDSPNFARLSQLQPDVNVTLKLDRTIGSIDGSPTHLSKVIMNSMVNAYDAMPAGGKLAVETSQQHLERLLGGYKQIVTGQYVLLRIRDTGLGIDSEDLDKIFEPYHSKKKLGYSGSGLGLSVVYGVVKDHKGYYDVFSTVGEGTEFVFYFPVCDEPTQVEQKTAINVEGNETVLVVDDIREQRELASEFLVSMGYEVVTAHGGREAIAYLRNHEIDIVVLDMILESDFDGLDTYREIIKIRPEQKAIIVSGFSATDRVMEMQDLGAGEFVKKPYTGNVLGRAVRMELDGTAAPGHR